MEYQKKKGSYKFTDKKHPIRAIFAVIIAAAVLVTVGVLSYKSSLSGGNGPLVYGIISFYAMILSFVGFILAVLSLKEDDIYYVFPVIGAVGNGIIFIGLFLLYMIGMAS